MHFFKFVLFPIALAIPLATEEEQTTEALEKRLLGLKPGEGSDLFRNYVKLGAYFGALYMFLEKNSIVGTNKVTTKTLDFKETTVLTNPCQVLTMTNSVPPEVASQIHTLSQLCHAARTVTSTVVPTKKPTSFKPSGLAPMTGII